MIRDSCSSKCRVALGSTAFQDFIIAKDLLERPGAQTTMISS